MTSNQSGSRLHQHQRTQRIKRRPIALFAASSAKPREEKLFSVLRKRVVFAFQQRSAHAHSTPKKFCSRHRNTSYVADSVGQHSMSLTMFIAVLSTLLANISTRLRRRRDTLRRLRAHFLRKLQTCGLASRGQSARPNRFGRDEIKPCFSREGFGRDV